MFKNLSFYRLPEAFTVPTDLDDRLAATPSRPLLSCQEHGAGWTMVDDARWSAVVNGATLVALEVSRKPIPADAVKRGVKLRIDKWAADHGKPPGKPEREAIKDDVRADLIARIPARVKTLRAYIDTAAGVLVVDTASDKAAEEVIQALRETAPGFACEPIGTKGNTVMNYMLESDCADPFEFGDQVTFVAEESKAVLAGFSVADDQVIDCVRAGMPVTRLGLSLGGQSFVLDDALRVRSYRCEDQPEADGDASEELDARLALLAGNVRELLDALHTAFGWRR
jgi:recombination associated protein RdgC